jgi:hypothetical protein
VNQCAQQYQAGVDGFNAVFGNAPEGCLDSKCGPADAGGSGACE